LLNFSIDILKSLEIKIEVKVTL